MSRPGRVAAVNPVLPNFLGLGAMRAGTTWLDQALRAHPEVWLPERRKEVHYFDRYFERGVDWYGEFFPSPDEARSYRAIGEITPIYLYEPRAAQRIHSLLPECRFLVSLRNPVDRAYSHYSKDVRDRAETRSFTECVDRMPELMDRGRYREQLVRYFDLFPRERFLILVFEETMCGPEIALRRVCDFLGVERTRLETLAGAAPVNASRAVRMGRTYAALRRVGGVLRRWDLDRPITAAKALGLRSVFQRAEALPPLPEPARARLLADFESEIRGLESLLEIDLSRWREPLSRSEDVPRR